jgi:serine-type D-Ala-D-Ala carboxypeptidase/endopeptidase (penicillin-binding protein 4)
VTRTLLLLFLVAACAGGLDSAADSGWRELVEAPGLAGARIGVAIVDTADGRVVFERDADRGFAPASNQKLLTAAIALATLGTEHRLTTDLAVRGEIADGELRGELRLVGHGDPTLGIASDLSALVAALRGHGVERVTGSVVGDGSWLGNEQLGLGWQWDYLDEDYAAPFGGLVWQRSLVRFEVSGSNPPEVRVSPPWFRSSHSRVAIAPVGRPTALRARRGLGQDLIEIDGSIAAGDRPPPFLVPVRDAAAFAADALRIALAAAGIAVDVREVATAAAPRRLGTLSSPPLAAIVAPMLTDSDNLAAENLWRVAARTAAGDGSTAAAATHGERTLQQLGVDTGGLVMADGSGLSRRNLVRPRQLAAVLVAAWRAPWRDAFVDGLPVAGRSGTLRARFRDGPAYGRVRAKTGFISRVVCLSGYLPRRDRAEPLAFSIMLNDFTGDEAGAKAAVDGFVQQLASAVGLVAGAESVKK